MNENLIEKESVLAETIKQSLAVEKKNNKNHVKRFLKHSSILLISAASGWLYIEPSQQYAQEHYPNDLKYKIFFEIGTTGGSIFVTLSSANLFLKNSKNSETTKN